MLSLAALKKASPAYRRRANEPASQIDKSLFASFSSEKEESFP
ncbi:MAG TPA: hypothetical protein VMB71_15235 [Acetobacteraceae bacterium]|nr:hypothetical protein [Acetobacteraceae bacterium]